MKRIKLTNGKYALIDDADYDFISSHKWCQNEAYGIHYARETRTNKGMHVLLMQPPKGMLIDHINHNGLDNRRVNLRIVTHTQNMQNRRKSKNNTSGYTGVVWNKIVGKWAAMIGYRGRLVALGYFTKKIDAAIAFDMAALMWRGEFAQTNILKLKPSP